MKQKIEERGINTLSIILLILMISWFIITEAFSLPEISSYKNVDNLSGILFGSIVTISVLSLTILSIMISSTHSYYGIDFQTYITYSSFPIKYRNLLNISFGTIIFSGVLLFYDSYILIFTSIYILLVLLIYSDIYFRFLFSDKIIRNFLLKKSTLRNNKKSIYSKSTEYFINVFQKQSIFSNIEILDFIKQVKIELLNDKNYSPKDVASLIEDNQTKLIHNLQNKIGFDFLLKNYIYHIINKDNYPEINRYINKELDSLEFCSLNVYKNNHYERQFRLFLLSSKDKDGFDSYFAYKLLYKTSMNINLNSSREYLLDYMIWDMLNMNIPDDLQIDNIIDNFSLIYKNLVCFNNDILLADILLNSIVKYLSDSPFIDNSDLKIKIITQMYIMSWGYIKLDNSINTNHRQLLNDRLKKIIKIDFSSISISLLKIISNNINDIVETLSLTDFEKFARRLDSLEYFPDFIGGMKTPCFSQDMLLKFYFYNIIILEGISKSQFNDEPNYFEFVNMENYMKLNNITQFTKMFIRSEDNLMLVDSDYNEINRLIQFLEINENIDKKADLFIKKIYYSANDKAKATKSIIEKQIINPNENSNHIIITQPVDNSGYFGGSNTIAEEHKNCILQNLGVSNRANKTKEDLLKFEIPQIEKSCSKMILKKYLPERKIGNNEGDMLELLKYLKNNNLTLISNLESFKRQFIGRNNYDELITIITKDFKDDNKNLDYKIAAINPNIFQYKILPLQITRDALTDDEVTEYINKYVKVAERAYKIGDIYYTYDEAFKLIKSQYVKDSVKIEYVVKNDAKEDTKPGNIIVF